MCVNSNLDLASSIIEKSTEERAIPEIEEMLEPELEARRRHRLQRPNEPYMDPSLSRWAMTIPSPFKMHPSLNGLNPEQMAIYEDFARQPRPSIAPAAASHVPSSSDATRSMANEVLQDQYSSVPSVPTPAETPSVPSAAPPLQSYPHGASLTNGRQAASNVDGRVVLDRVQKLVSELARASGEASEEHFTDLPRPHPVLDFVDALVQTIIKTQQSTDDFAVYAAEQLCNIICSPMVDSTLVLETAVHVLETLRKIAGPALNHRVTQFFHAQPGQNLLHYPLISALMGTDLLDWRAIDAAMAAALRQRKEGSIQFLLHLMEQTLLNESPLTLYADFIHSLEEAWIWISEDPDVPYGQQLKAKVMPTISELSTTTSAAQDGLSAGRRDQIEYVFEEWVHLCNNPNASDKIVSLFVEQLRTQRIINNRDDFFVFTRLAIDKSVERFEMQVHTGGTVTDGYISIDALTRLVTIFVRDSAEEAVGNHSPRAALLDSVLALGVILLNHHHVKRGENFNQKVFFRFFSMLLHGISGISEELSDVDRNEVLLRFAARFNDLGPVFFPGFLYAWMALIQHRIFLPSVLQMPGNLGWAPFTKIMKQLLEFAGEQLKPVELSSFAKDVYRATLKLLAVLQHDFPDFLVANHMALCESIPPHCAQFINMILVASPLSTGKMPDPMQPGLRTDRMDEAREVPSCAEDPAAFLARTGLLGLVDQALRAGPTEEVVAHITHAIKKADAKATAHANVPIGTNIAVIDALVAYIGSHVVARVQSGGPVFAPDDSDFATLSMVLHELGPEGRYFFLCSMVNQLRYMNTHTNYFSQVVLEIFGSDMADPEEMEVREQICRILFERLFGYWPQPWGLMVTAVELVKNEKYMFFDLPFIKGAPEVSGEIVRLCTGSSR